MLGMKAAGCPPRSRVTSVGPMNWGNSMIASFSGMVAQCPGLVEHACAFALGLLQQVGGVEVLAVKRRVLAHQHRASNSTSSAVRSGCAVVPVLRGIARQHGCRCTLGHDLAAALPGDVLRARTPPCVWPRRWASRIMAKVVSL